MIRGLHGMFYSSDADATRAFLREKVKLPHVDVGGGWLIFDLPEGDLGVHPIDSSGRPPANTHDVSFYCDDIEGTVSAMKARGVVFDGEIEDHGYGLVTYIAMPGGVRAQLYEPRYTKGPAARAAKATKKATKKAEGKATSKKATRKATPKAAGKATPKKPTSRPKGKAKPKSKA